MPRSEDHSSWAAQSSWIQALGARSLPITPVVFLDPVIRLLLWDVFWSSGRLTFHNRVVEEWPVTQGLTAGHDSTGHFYGMLT